MAWSFYEWYSINGRIGIEHEITIDDISGLTHLSLDKMAAIVADDNSKCILNENNNIPIRISLKFVPRSPIDNKPALV